MILRYLSTGPLLDVRAKKKLNGEMEQKVDHMIRISITKEGQMDIVYSMSSKKVT